MTKQSTPQTPVNLMIKPLSRPVLNKPRGQMLMESLISGADWLPMDMAVEALSEAANVYGYDEWVSDAPPLPAPLPGVQPEFTSPITASVVQASLDSFIGNMLSRQWSSTSKVWFCRRVQAAAPLSHEWAVHPQLVGIQVPSALVEHFVVRATAQLERAAVFHAIETALPEQGDTYEAGARDSLESSVLALESQGVSAVVIQSVVDSVLDAISNNEPGDRDGQGDVAPSALIPKP